MLNKSFWDENPELNITPLVDVMLVLLAILMLATQAIVYDEKISLPQGSKSKVLEESKKYVIRLDKEQVVYFETNKIPLSVFESQASILFKDILKTETVVIRADKELQYKQVVTLLGIIKKLGFSHVSLATEG